MVSSSINSRTSSLHIWIITDKRAKRLVENWTRYSSSKICRNESMKTSRAAQSREKDSNSHASTHLSEFDLLAPVGQSARMPSNIGPPPAEEEELEYTNAQTEPMPHQPIALEPPLQRRHAHAAVSICVSVSEFRSLIASCRNDCIGDCRDHEISLCLRY